MGVHGQGVVARAEPVDHSPRRHERDGVLGQPEHLAGPRLPAAANPRQPARDVLRRGAVEVGHHRLAEPHRVAVQTNLNPRQPVGVGVVPEGAGDLAGGVLARDGEQEPVFVVAGGAAELLGVEAAFEQGIVGVIVVGDVEAFEGLRGGQGDGGRLGPADEGDGVIGIMALAGAGDGVVLGGGTLTGNTISDNLYPFILPSSFLK